MLQDATAVKGVRFTRVRRLYLILSGAQGSGLAIRTTLLTLLAADHLNLSTSARCLLQGSLVHKDDIADFDDPLVEVLESRGAIIIGKTNIPEFSAGETDS